MNITDDIRAKLQKVYALVNQGATEGERQAAKLALDRLISKHKLKDINLESLDRKVYVFKYATELDKWLFAELVRYFLGDSEKEHLLLDNWRGTKSIEANLRYLDYITIEASYGYFRQHMRKQWEATCAPLLAKCRKPKTRNRRRRELQPLFFSSYIIASKLYREGDLVTSKVSSEKEMRDRMAVAGVEGGQYHRQMTSEARMIGAGVTVTGQQSLF